MDMDKEFGSAGADLYTVWENRYAQISKDIRFGGKDPQEGLED